jgi:exodeoxyribonuclease VII large subunit
MLEPRRRTLEEVRRGLHRAGRTLVEPRRRGLEQVRGGLQRAVRSLIQGRRHVLARLGGKMDALSPLATLRRGYAVPLGAGGRVLRGVEDFSPGESFELRVVDGRVECQVRDIQQDEV